MVTRWTCALLAYLALHAELANLIAFSESARESARGKYLLALTSLHCSNDKTNNRLSSNSLDLLARELGFFISTFSNAQRSELAFYSQSTVEPARLESSASSLGRCINRLIVYARRRITDGAHLQNLLRDFPLWAHPTLENLCILPQCGLRSCKMLRDQALQAGGHT